MEVSRRIIFIMKVAFVSCMNEGVSAVRSRKLLLVVSVIVLACSVIGAWHYGHLFYWGIYYPSLGRTPGSPLVTDGKIFRWTSGLVVSVVLGIVSLMFGFKNLVHGRRSEG